MPESIPPADPDSDPRAPARRSGLPESPWAVLGLVAAGGALGALGRHAVAVALPHAPGEFGWATLVVNLSGCALIGVLMELLAHRRPGSRLIRPFFGAGVLGGYTTFSAAVLDVTATASTDPRTALAYLAATLVGSLIAVSVASTAAAAVLARPRRERSAP
ncbi:camphor resistance protein CrcB [Murinocardiopsis flavida]|uniref:Fluoride-specific ion channel FluC n=1 Tax=Murinocardiopsis flavida TaxID=645275 RepID=A0A2P8D8V6_9ACTN|nr:CrcB family protein [Murinocardiopsis flavida]PSK93645.1 camphor resistance protein CrcB [Murinocardiopsis flavida]